MAAGAKRFKYAEKSIKSFSVATKQGAAEQQFWVRPEPRLCNILDFLDSRIAFFASAAVNCSTLWMFRFSSRDIFEGCITEQQPGKPTAFDEGIHTDYKKDVQHAPSGDRHERAAGRTSAVTAVSPNSIPRLIMNQTTSQDRTTMGGLYPEDSGHSHPSTVPKGAY
jgi:hypothetical protein